jgi:hypothetical protein
MDVKSRFWNKVRIGNINECWNWQACVGKSGYGRFNLNGRNATAPRVAWELAFGKIPNELCVCHYCDNRLCCNPFHLFLGTVADNNQDMMLKGRFVPPIGSHHGRAKLSEQQVLDIRKAHQDGKSLCGLARQYGMSAVGIGDICKHKLWRHI